MFPCFALCFAIVRVKAFVDSAAPMDGGEGHSIQRRMKVSCGVHATRSAFKFLIIGNENAASTHNHYIGCFSSNLTFPPLCLPQPTNTVHDAFP